MAEIGTVRAVVKRVAAGMPAGATVGEEITMSEAQFDKHAAAGNVDSADTLTRAQQRGQASAPTTGPGSAAEARQVEEKENEERASQAFKADDAKPSSKGTRY